MKYKIHLLIAILLFFCLNRSEAQTEKNKADSLRFAKITNALYEWNIVQAINELKVISTTQNPADESYFNFFKATIVFYSWKQTDSTRENTSLASLDTATKYYERALSLDKSLFFSNLYIKSAQMGLDTCASIWGQRAKMYYLNQDYLKSLAYYEKIIDFKFDPMFLTGAGMSALQLTSYPKAIRYLSQSLALNPTSEKSWLALIEVYKRQKDTANAIATALLAANSDSTNLNLLVNYIKVVTQYKIHNSDATLQIKKLERIKPKNPLIFGTLGNYYLSHKDYEKAEPNFKSLAQNENAPIMLKFYYNWYLTLYSSDLLKFKDGNSLSFMHARIKNWVFIKNKVRPYLTAHFTMDKELEMVVDFFKKEFDL